MKTTYNLFLDDERFPKDVFWKKDICYTHFDWVIVRTAAQFIAQITVKGVPQLVSFDNDLGDFSGTGGLEITGYDLAKLLCYHCIDKRLNFPRVFAHSRNVVDQPKIEAFFDNACAQYPSLKAA